MTDHLSPEDNQRAASRGWTVADVYDMKSRRWLAQIMPTRNGALQDPYKLLQAVLQQAAQGDALSIQALRYVAHYKPGKPR